MLESQIHIRETEFLTDQDIEDLSHVLIDCVDGGASVSFMSPMTLDKARLFWTGVRDSAARGERTLYIANYANSVVGTTQIVWAQEENQPHRADLAKMLVHRRARCRGIGSALLAAAEHGARQRGRNLLVLDTATGGDAERLYSANGWQRCGEIPDYAKLPDGRLSSTTVFYKSLGG